MEYMEMIDMEMSSYIFFHLLFMGNDQHVIACPQPFPHPHAVVGQ